jgi:hypothetical protein
MEKLRAAPHSEPLTDTWTSDFLSRERESREVVGERLRDKTVPWQVQRRLLQAITCTEWVSVEATNAPCVNELGSEGRTISTKGVDGVTLKNWATFRVRAVVSKRERLHRRTITAGSKFSGK